MIAMNASMMLKVTILLVFVALVPLVKCEDDDDLGPFPKWCIRQIVHANHACSRLPYQPSPFAPRPDRPPKPKPPHGPFPKPEPPHRPDPGPDSPFEPDPRPETPGEPGPFLPFVPFPLSPSKDNDWDFGGASRKIQIYENYGKKGSHAEKKCCDLMLWKMDLECVCRVLVYLPSFLSKPYHEYTVDIGSDGRVCKITFSCPGRVLLPGPPA